MKKRALIISISSDIAIEICRDWQKAGFSVSGTYRTKSAAVSGLESHDVRMWNCDLASTPSVDAFIKGYVSEAQNWDVILFATGLQDPIGLFNETKYSEWESSVQVNALNQLKILHALLPLRNKNSGAEPTVMFFAGAGSNGAPPYYSAYITSKIILTKMTEILAAEIPDTKFVIIGPGWVKTKIHESTLKVGPSLARENYEKTKEKLASDECTQMDKVVETFNWALKLPLKAVSGRNLSVAFDSIGNVELEKQLMRDGDMYKLRRAGNSWRP